jgi:hypothetical protein
MNGAKKTTKGARNKLLLIPTASQIFEVKDPSELIGPVSTLDFNHVLYRTQGKEGDEDFKVSFLNSFDCLTWSCILLSLLLQIITNFVIDYVSTQSVFMNKISLFSSQIYFYCNSMIVSLSRRYFPVGKGRITAAGWLIGLFFLVRFFTSDMLALLSIKVPETVINTVEDLCARKDVPIKVMTIKEDDVHDRFLEGTEVERCLAERIEIVDALQIMLTNEGKKAFFMGINEGNYATIMERNMGRSIIKSYEKEMPNLYQSKHEIESEPFYLRFISTTDEHIERLLGTIVERTRETGIIIKWISDADKTKNDMNERKVGMEYMTITLQMFYRIFHFYLYACFLCTTILVMEIMSHFVKRIKVWLRSEYLTR